MTDQGPYRYRAMNDAHRVAREILGEPASVQPCRVAGDGQHDPGLTPGPHSVTCTKCGDVLPLDHPMPKARIELTSREEMRHGQWLWNHAMAVFPSATEATRGTAADCFYDDQKVTVFLRALVERAHEGCLGCGKVLVVPEENKPYWCGECVSSGRMQSATPSKLEAIEKFARDNPRASMGQLVDLFFGGVEAEG